MSTVPLHIQSYILYRNQITKQKRWKIHQRIFLAIIMNCLFDHIYYDHEPHLVKEMSLWISYSFVVLAVECLVLLHLTSYFYCSDWLFALTMWGSWRYFPVLHSFLYSSTVSSFVYPCAKLTFGSFHLLKSSSVFIFVNYCKMPVSLV